MLGMTAVRGGQTQTTGYPQPRVGLYKTTDGGASWTLLWVPPLDPVLPPNPNLAIGVGDTMFGVRQVKLDPRQPAIVYATAWNNAIHRSAPSLEGGDASFKPVFAIVGVSRFQDLAMFDLTVKNGHTRMYVYNGTSRPCIAGAVPAGQRGRAGGVARHRQRRRAGEHVARGSRSVSNSPSQPGSTSANLCGAQCFYDLVVAMPPGQPDTVIVGGVATAAFGESDDSIDQRRRELLSVFGIDAAEPAEPEPRGRARHRVPSAEPDIAFVGSDGGVVRNDGTFVDITNRCAVRLQQRARSADVLSARCRTSSTS